MDKTLNKGLVDHLAKFITPQRLDLFNSILERRTRYITVVLEDIFQPHNASAVLRTCDCFGIQDVHIIENNNIYEVNPDVALGASKWINLHKYNSGTFNTMDAYQSLKSKGYTLIATSPHEGGYLLDEVPLDIRPAFIFGTELNGLSGDAIKHADAFVKIPMYGFTESFNISVSAAIILHHYSEKLRASDIDWRLSKEDMIDIKLDWLRNSIKRSDLIEKEFLKII